MYDRQIYEKTGGFTRKAIFNEDMIYAAAALKSGFRVGYCSEAMVIHSHRMSALSQFHRNFDNGVSQSENPEVFAGIKSEGEGVKLVKGTAGYLLKCGKWYLIPGMCFASGMKYLGFKLGQNYRKLPVGMVKRFALNRSYFNR